MPHATFHDDIANLKIKQVVPADFKTTVAATTAMVPVKVPDFKHIKVKQIAQTFAAEVFGVDFSKPVSKEVHDECFQALSLFAVLYFRHANLDNKRQIAFGAQFGELDSAKPWVVPGEEYRFEDIEIFDVANVESDGSLVKIGSKRHHIGMVNQTFHCDLSYNPRRAGIGLLRPAVLPPPGNGGPTEFADTRTAYDDLPESVKKFLDDNEFISCNNLIHSRLATAPKDSPYLVGADPESSNFGRHALVQTHERSGRKVLYIGVHCHHLEYKTPRSKDFKPTPGQPFERVPEPESWEIITWLRSWCEQPKYVASCEWHNENDLVVWDNTACMHRTGAGTFAGKYIRDMRRCTCHDDSSIAWGYNDKTQQRVWYPEVNRYMYPKIG